MDREMYCQKVIEILNRYTTESWKYAEVDKEHMRFTIYYIWSDMAYSYKYNVRRLLLDDVKPNDIAKRIISQLKRDVNRAFFCGVR